MQIENCKLRFTCYEYLCGMIHRLQSMSLSKEFQLPTRDAFGAPRLGGVLGVQARIIAQVAPLAERAQIVVSAVLWVVVKVGHGEHHAAARLRMRLPIARATKLATPVRALPDAPGNRGPVCRVEVTIEGHEQTT